MLIDVQQIIKEIDEAIKEYDDLCVKSRLDDCSDQPEDVALMVTNRMASTLYRLSPPGSIHRSYFEKIWNESGHRYYKLKPLKGGLLALRREYDLGCMRSFAEIVHADMFTSFIDMADHLYEQGYKDPAAVIAGSVLEQHLRELCKKNAIVLDINGKPKKADSLNTDLAAHGVYSKLDQKNVTSWLGLRNESAHGNYSNYNAQQVRLMIDAVQDFMGRYPA